MTHSPMATRARRWRAALAAGLVVVTITTVVTQGGSPASAAPVTYTGAGSSQWTIGVIGDSAWAGIRWSGAWAPLRRFNYRADLESCRRTTGYSCRGREGYAPLTTLGTLQSAKGVWGSVLVVATGYNDYGQNFASGVDAVMAEARSQGIPKVVWMTMRTDVSYVAPVYGSNAATFRNNNAILRQKASQYGGRLVIADWAAHSSDRAGWFTSDGIHTTPTGAIGAAQFIADSAASALRGMTFTSTSPTASTGGTYTVVSGDCWACIASKLGVSMSSLLAANGASTSTAIYPGQTVKVPGSSPPTATPAAPATTTPTASAGGTYTVVSGDCWACIASKLGVSMSSLLAANGASTSTVIHPGQRLKLPGASTPAATTPAATAPAPTTPAAPLGGYVVASGDCWYCIARKLGVSMSSLLAANGATTSTAIYPGQTLKVPGVASSPNVPAPPPSSGGGTYTVVSGDCWYCIASKLRVWMSSLLAVNGATTATVLHPGQTLRVPASA